MANFGRHNHNKTVRGDVAGSSLPTSGCVLIQSGWDQPIRNFPKTLSMDAGSGSACPPRKPGLCTLRNLGRTCLSKNKPEERTARQEMMRK